MFETIQPKQLGNPIGEGFERLGNMITEARIRQKAEEERRAKFLLDKSNIEADNRRADAQMGLQQAQFNRTGANQDLERRRQGGDDFTKFMQMAGHNAEIAKQLAKAYGYAIDDSDPSQPVAVKVAPSMVPPSVGGPVDQSAAIGPAPEQAAPVGPPPGPQAPQPTPMGQHSGSPGEAPPAPPPDLRQQIMSSFDQAAAVPAAGPPPQLAAAPMAQAPPPPPPPPPPTVGQSLQTASSRGVFRVSGGAANMPPIEIDPAAARAMQDEEFNEKIRLHQAAPEVRAASLRLENEQKESARIAKQAHDDESRATYHLTASDQNKNAAARTAAIAAGRADTNATNLDKDTNATINTFQGVVKELKAASLAKQDVFVKKLLSKVDEELAGGPAAQAGAVDTLGQIFQGGKATNAVLSLLKDPTGMLGTAADKLYMATHSGQHSPAVIAAFTDAARRVRAAVTGNALQDIRVARSKIGPGTMWDTDATRDLANQELAAQANEYSLSPDELATLDAEGEAPPAARTGMGLSPGRAITRHQQKGAKKGGHQESDADFLSRVLK